MFERFLATFVVLEREDPGSLGQEEWEKNGGGGVGHFYVFRFLHVSEHSEHICVFATLGSILDSQQS